MGEVVSQMRGGDGALGSCPAGLKAEVGLRWCGIDAALTERRILMSKSVRKRSVAPAAGGAAKAPQQGTIDPRSNEKAEPDSKQSRVIVCVPKTRFCNIGDEVRRGQAVM